MYEYAYSYITSTTCHRKQQILVIRNRRNRRYSADFWLGSASSIVPELPISGEQITIIRRAWKRAQAVWLESTDLPQ